MTDQNIKNQELTLSPDDISQESTKDLIEQNISQENITVQEISHHQDCPYYTLSWLESGHEWMLSLKQDCMKMVQQPKTTKVIKKSPQGMFLETLITVGLLVMALWMQAVPHWQSSSPVDKDAFSFPAFEN